MHQSKRRRIDSSSVVATFASAADATNTPEETKPPPYLKLIADCWEHIREYHPTLEFEIFKREVYYQDVCLQTDFHPFVVRLTIWRDDELRLLLNVKTFR